MWEDRGFAERLRTEHEVEIEVEARERPPGPVKEVFTRDLPRVGPTNHLDESGLVRVGARVRGGDILVGRLRPPTGEVSAEEKLLGSIFGERVERGEDTSVSAPSWMEGTVVESGFVGETARVTIAWDRPLAVGDRLVFGDGSVRTVVAIRALEADLALAEPPEDEPGALSSGRQDHLLLLRIASRNASAVTSESRASTAHLGGALVTACGVAGNFDRGGPTGVREGVGALGQGEFVALRDPDSAVAGAGAFFEHGADVSFVHGRPPERWCPTR